jgi:hypothetical protein
MGKYSGFVYGADVYGSGVATDPGISITRGLKPELPRITLPDMGTKLPRLKLRRKIH